MDEFDVREREKKNKLWQELIENAREERPQENYVVESDNEANFKVKLEKYNVEKEKGDKPLPLTLGNYAGQRVKVDASYEKYCERRRREGEFNRLAVETLKTLTDRGKLVKDGVLDVQKSEMANDYDVNFFVHM